MSKEIRHVGWKVERCRYSLLERIYAEEWMKACRPQPGLNYGYGLLQDLFIRPAEGHTLRRHNGARLVITQRDAFVAATAVQWLGSNVGHGFVTRCLQRAGLRVEQAGEEWVSDRYYSRIEQDGCFVHPAAWYEHARQFAYYPPPPLEGLAAPERVPWERLKNREERHNELQYVVHRQHEDRRRAEQLERWRQSHATH